MTTRRTILITGARGGIGSTTARLFAQRGNDLVLCSTMVPEDLVGELRAYGGRVLALPGDLSDLRYAESLVGHAHAEMGRIDVIISNAGIGGPGTVETCPTEEFNHIIAVNLVSSFQIAKAAIPIMRKAGGGVILFSSAVAAHVAAPNSMAYSVSKAAQMQLIHCMAIDHGPDNIRVAAVSPGPVYTPMLDKVAHFMGVPSVDAFAAFSPLGRISEPIEVAEAFYYLASDSARSITGTTIVLDNGMSAGAYHPPRPMGLEH